MYNMYNIKLNELKFVKFYHLIITKRKDLEASLNQIIIFKIAKIYRKDWKKIRNDTFFLLSSIFPYFSVLKFLELNLRSKI